MSYLNVVFHYIIILNYNNALFCIINEDVPWYKNLTIIIIYDNNNNNNNNNK